MIRVHLINLQKAVGGGEIYTRWFTRALARAGADVTLYVDRGNAFWSEIHDGNVTVVPVSKASDISEFLPRQDALVITQSGIPADVADQVSRNHVLTGFAHMPMLGRSASEFKKYATVFTVSRYCIDLLRRAGIDQVYPEPMYGTFELDRDSSTGQPILAASPYHWDQRKGRDKVLSVLEPLAEVFRPPRQFAPKPGLTLGIVSLLSPIKQFPALFTALAPRIAAIPEVNLEIFGNGGYAQVRDLRRSLAPIADRVRFWGYQTAVQNIYPNLDYLMTGLPEKEALGLNVLEAQALGTPVVAPNAPPFTETIVHESGGFLYADPRLDGGEDFAKLLSSLAAGRQRPDPRKAIDHLAQFSFASMVSRTRTALEHLMRVFPQISN